MIVWILRLNLVTKCIYLYSSPDDRMRFPEYLVQMQGEILE